MPRYVPTEYMVDAILYDGSVDTAVACAQLAGASATLVFPDGHAILRINDVEVTPPVWIVRACGGAVRSLAPVLFEAEYFLIDRPPPDPAMPILPTIADRHRSPSSRGAGEIREGDTIRDRAETDPKLAVELLEVLEIGKDGNLLCDWAWGTKTIPLADAILVQAGE